MSDWKVSPYNFRPWGGLYTVETKRSMGPPVTLDPIPNMTIDLRYAKSNYEPPWWALFWEPARGGWKQ